MTSFDIIVIGGGQSGLVTGYFLNQHNVSYTVLDANDAPGGSWQHYYESLKIFSPARYAQLPGLPFPSDPAHYPDRYEVINYLTEYERVHNIPVERGVRVQSVAKSTNTFTLTTSTGAQYTASAIISASGPFNTPYMPTHDGVEHFQGQRIHSYDYHTPQPYADQHVVVIGARDSAMQIAYDLKPHARVTMAVRHDLMFMPKYLLGKSIFWWLHDTGYDQLPLGLFSQLEGSKRIVGREPYQTALDEGNPAVRPMFTRFTENGVIWADGTEEPVDTVIYATGFNPGLGYLRELGALNSDGYADHYNGASNTVDGLYYVGLFGQRSHASATLRGVGRDAAHIAAQAAPYAQEHRATTSVAAPAGD
ncbi:MAG: NAD(P)-binding domain-containing protein [Chloroflexota bacterium]